MGKTACCGVQRGRTRAPERNLAAEIVVLNAVNRHPNEGVDYAFNMHGRTHRGASATVAFGTDSVVSRNPVASVALTLRSIR
jgi:hypothetical protein